MSCYLTMSFLITVAIILCWDLQSAASQNPIPANFETYQNPTLGLKLQYPSDWKVDEDSASDGIVRFNTGDEFRTGNPIFVVSIDEVRSYLDTDTMTLKNTSLTQSVAEKLIFYSQLSREIAPDFKLVRQNELTVGGNNATKLEYTMGIFYWFEALSVANGKLYTLTYKDLPLDVPKSLPLANKVVESFEITG